MKNLKNAFSSRRRKLLLGVPALGLGAFAAPAVLAQTAWPAKSITLLVGFAPGGQTDFAGRILTGGMQTVLGQPVVIAGLVLERHLLARVHLELGGRGEQLPLGRGVRLDGDGVTAIHHAWDGGAWVAVPLLANPTFFAARKEVGGPPLG